MKRLHPKRGKEVIEAINIIPRYGGALIHHCWSSCLSYAHCGHGLCGSHLLCELTLIVDANGYCRAKKMKSLLQEACKAVSKSRIKCLTNGYNPLLAIQMALDGDAILNRRELLQKMFSFSEPELR